MAAIDLSLLPAPDVIEVIDFETILAERKAFLIALYPAEQQAEVAKTLALESEPIVRLLQENAYRETILRQRINEAANAVNLAYARGADLDQRGANVNLVRLVITPADDEAVPPIAAVMESDESFRERIQLANEGLSVAGPRLAYIKHARDADGRVSDASAISPAGAEVVVSILSTENNGVASADLIAKVDDYLSDEDRRPLGDRLTVQSAAIVDYQIKGTLYFSSAGPEAEVALAAATARVEAYRSERRRLGRSINRTAIIAAMHAEGVERVVLDLPPADVVLDKTQASYCTSVELINGGAVE